MAMVTEQRVEQLSFGLSFKASKACEGCLFDGLCEILAW